MNERHWKVEEEYRVTVRELPKPNGTSGGGSSDTSTGQAILGCAVMFGSLAAIVGACLFGTPGFFICGIIGFLGGGYFGVRCEL